MNLNLIAYGIYLFITIYIIVVVGRVCYRNGNIYVQELIPGHEQLCQYINKILLVGYYLVNIGYATMTLINWEKILSASHLIEVIASRSAIIIGLLSILHYFNIFILTKYIQKLIH